jgi:hypothetical protein
MQESELDVQVDNCMSSTVAGSKSDGLLFLWGLQNEHIYEINPNTIQNRMERLQEIVARVDADVLNRVRDNAVLRIEMDGGPLSTLTVIVPCEGDICLQK